jgi:hypothetical protein
MCQKSKFDARTIGGLGAQGSLVGVPKSVYSVKLTLCQQRRSYHSKVLVSSIGDIEEYIPAIEVFTDC